MRGSYVELRIDVSSEADYLLPHLPESCITSRMAYLVAAPAFCVHSSLCEFIAEKGARMTPVELLLLVWIIAVGIANARDKEDLGL